ncbi:alpha/beta hydrolase [Rossellomorea sp. NPDC077527]|uniref:alpha/beta hydrolase n=1 Tax=Rossellomorea sp. NPDC077527 TaxID=3364510 RepID=UPI0037C7CEB7
MKVTSDVMRGYRHIEVPYTLLSPTEEPGGIAIFLPGMGYTVQAPLLHYSTGLYLNKGYDVLHINYQYSSSDYKGFSIEEKDDALRHDVKKMMNQILTEKSYSHIHVVAKSLGTLALGNEIHNERLQDSKFVWLTPLLKEDEVFQAVMDSEQEGICIAGDRDPHFDEERFNRLKGNKRMHVHVVKDVNHSLEHDFQVIDSISTHREILSVIKAFIEA